MKIISLFLLLICFFTVSCSTDDGNDILDESINITELEYQGQQYGISKKVQLESFTNCLDTNYIAFSGHTENRLWIACFEKSTKKKLLEWKDNKLLQTEITIDMGYGESKKFDINKRSFTQNPYFNQNSMVFLLSMEGSAGRVSSNIYFLKNSQLQKIVTSYYLPPNYIVFEKLHQWYNNSIIVKNGSKYICYSETGEEIFSFEEHYLSSEKMDPINYYEGIKLSKVARRINLKDNIVVWENTTSTIADLPDNVRIDNTTLVKKDNNIWTYAINYTLYDGKKGKKEIKLDINTGEYN